MARPRIRLRRPGQRWMIVALAFLAGLILARHLAQRSGRDAPPQRPATEPAAAALGLERGERTRLVAFARARLEGGAAVAMPENTESRVGGAERIALVSLGRRDRTALVAVGRGLSFAAAVAAAVDDLAAHAGGRLKLDLVAEIGPQLWFADGGRAALGPANTRGEAATGEPWGLGPGAAGSGQRAEREDAARRGEEQLVAGASGQCSDVRGRQSLVGFCP